MSFMCEKCSKLFEHEKSLNNHLINCSGPESEGKQIRCPQCKIPVVKMDLLRNHVENVHNVTLEDEKYFFKTVNEYLDWKVNMEKDTDCYYFLKSSAVYSGVKRTHLLCNRSGYTSNNRLRKVRRTKSIKIDGICTSTLVVNEDTSGVNVTFCKTHFGHGSSAQRSLTENEREIVAEKIADGVPVEEILNQVNDQSSNMDDMKIVFTIHDLFNIRQDYNNRIISNHYKAQLIKDQKVLHISDSVWIVESPSESSEHYQVTKVKHVCERKNCMLTCRFCNICTHMYICDCSEHTSRPNISICKHIHTCIQKKDAYHHYGDIVRSSRIEKKENEKQNNEKEEQNQKVLIFHSTTDGCKKISVTE